MTTPPTATPLTATPLDAIEPWLREILRCPRCHAALRDDVAASELVCTSQQCGLAYRFDEGIPVLLVDEARAPGDASAPGPR